MVEPNGGGGQGADAKRHGTTLVRDLGASTPVPAAKALQLVANSLPPSLQGHGKSLGNSPAPARKGAAAAASAPAPAAAQHMFAGGGGADGGGSGEDPARLCALSRMVVSMLGSTEAEQQLVGARAAAGGLVHCVPAGRTFP